MPEAQGPSDKNRRSPKDDRLRGDNPNADDPEAGKPENAVPQPGDSDPKNADPENADPENADPENADPKNADPENADPENVEVEESITEVPAKDQTVAGSMRDSQDDSHSQNLSDTIRSASDDNASGLPAENDSGTAEEPTPDGQQTVGLPDAIPSGGKPGSSDRKPKRKRSILKRIGRYRVEKEIGKGGFGNVYLAYDETLRRQVAIKAPRIDLSVESLKENFLTEARQLARLKHSGIVGVLDVITLDEGCYIVSDFIDGLSLRNWLKVNNPDWCTSVKICEMIANALAHAHANRTVHRDLKPANIILTAGNQPVIVDFGLSVSDEQRARGTQRGDISGTVRYMSPEQARGEGHRIDGRTDIYSLGVVLYRMLTGRTPFIETDMHEMLRQIEEDEPQPPRQIVRDLPRELDLICSLAMAKSVRERYTTADDMAHDLRSLLNKGPQTGSPFNSYQYPDSPSASQKTSSAAENSQEPGWFPTVDEDSALPPSVTDMIPDSDRTPNIRSGESHSDESHSDESHSGESHSQGSMSTSRQRASQRRQVTIVTCGCDLFESEEIQSNVDSDEQIELLEEFQDFCRGVVPEFQGSVLQETNDGIAVCFGFPVAFEDSVPQAVRFGREVLRRMPVLNAKLKSLKIKLNACVIAHTDVAIVEATGESMEDSSISVVGTIRNFTTKLEQVAEPDTMIVTEKTLRLTRGKFSSESLGDQRIRGLPGVVKLFRITAETAEADPGNLDGPSADSPLIGRDRELDLLKDRWEQAAEGMGQVVLVIGEAGLGKSRIVQALKRHVIDQSGANGASIIEWRSSQQRQNSSLFPAIECFERLLLIERDDSPPIQLDKLTDHLRDLNLDGEQEIELIASLLSIPLEGRLPELKLSPQQQREQTDQLLLDWLKELSSKRPLLFVIEDLHWVDPSTLEFVDQFVDQGLNDRILTLFTFRPEFETPWKSKAHQTNLALNRLTKRQIQEMMELKAGRALPSSLVEQIIERTDGVPLFVEEFTQMMIESSGLTAGADSTMSNTFTLKQIPASLQDMMMSRIDRIDCDQSVIQLGSVIGRTFPLELIRAASAFTAESLQHELNKLVEAELLFAQGRGARVRYQFKHALLQDAAYNSLVKSKRQEFHGRVAAAIEAGFPDICEKEPEVLAQHYTDAHLPEKALDYWQRAGERSLRRYAYREAIQQLRAGLEVVPEIPESRQRDLQEIQIHVTLGVPLQSIIGYSAPEVEENYARAFQLCQELKLTDENFPILYGLFRYYMLQAKYGRTLEIARELVSLADQSQKPDFVVAAHRAVGSPLIYQGEYAAAMPHLDQVLAIKPNEEMRKNVNQYDVVDPWIAAGSYRSWALWLTGHPQQALDQSRRTLADADSLEHPFTISLAVSFSTWLHQFRRDYAATLEAANRVLELSTKHEFQFWIGWGDVLKYWSLGMSQGDSDAYSSIGEGIAAWRAQGSELGSAYFYAMQAEVALAMDRHDDADTALRQGEQFANATSEGFPVPEIHRLRGELATSRRNEREAEDCFRTAIKVARKQGSNSYHLRAMISLSRLLQSGGRSDEAVESLDAILNQFTEGHDTHDLIEAVRLRDELKST